MANVSLSTSEAPIYVVQTEYDSVPIWSIVVVSFCLLIICLLSVSFYFVCQLYRNEKRQNYLLQKTKTYRNDVQHHVVIAKNEVSKTELIEDEYAAIPGDIGAKEKRKNNEESMTKRESYSFKIRNSTHNIANLKNLRAEQKKNDQNKSMDIEDYAELDQKVVALKPNTESLKGTKLQTRKSSQSVTTWKKSSDSTQKAFSQKIQRRYSAELEFNQLDKSNFRKRQTIKTQQHHYNQTQDDMIFLSFEQYLEPDDDGNEYDDEDEEDEIVSLNEFDSNSTMNKQRQLQSFSKLKQRSSRRITSKEEFSRISTRRAVKLYAPQEIKYDDIDFRKSKSIGKGSFGEVFKAKYHEIDVAVKKLHAQSLSGTELINFKREAAIMQKVGGHKHIARMYGFCTTPKICIVTEYYARGSLYELFVRKKNEKRIPTKMRIRMSIEASMGIWHLHQQQVIHRDISARNLLVDRNWTVVVADLGMSRLKRSKVNGANVVKSNIGPVKWMAPESIVKHQYSEKTDSYSFGITLFEIFSESQPYPGLLPLEAGAKVVHEGLRPAIDKNKKITNVPNLSKLLTMLWKTKAKDRPNFLFITQSLKKIQKQWLIKKSRFVK